MSSSKHHVLTVLFTGYSGAGKSFFANAVYKELLNTKINIHTLDGDDLRKTLNKDLGYSLTDRAENIRRVGAVCRLFNNAGMVVLASFIAPNKEHRETIKKAVGSHQYLEVFVDTSLKTCKERDVKQLYKRAENGEIKNMTGVDAPYEKPINPDIIISENTNATEAVHLIYTSILQKINFS